MRKVGIIGSGIVARTLGTGFLKHGYEVMIGSRDASKLAEWKAGSGAHAQTGTFEQAAKFGDLVVLAVKGAAAADAIDLAGPQNLHWKTVIDTTNPIAAAPPENGVLKYFSSINESLMEQLQHRFPEVHFVKAFNSVGNGYMVDPKFSEKPTMFICGNKDASRKEVSDILVQFGWEVEDMGKAPAARAIEPLCMLWCIPGLQDGKWNHAFRLMRG
ncbi:NAD(P)-binding domain-containing protein [Nemorincola caseinilytica]|uniref:NAD(P)-binding domain-containing protein n=1 Tax=Nemorincola caseinilytica TaxID=2054315 RepID=A0ABP8N0U8_9BACT